MKKAIIFIVAIILALLLCSEVLAVDIQKSVVPADAMWVINIDMKKFTATRLHELMMKDEATVKIRKKTARLFKLYRFDPLKDIANITIFGKGKDEEDAVVYVEANFDKEHLIGLIEGETGYQEIPYGKYTVYKWGRDDFGVFVSDKAILFSENEEAIKTALDVADGKKENISSSPMMKYVKAIPSDAFLMAIADNISSLVGKHDKAVMLKKTGMASFAIMEKKDDVALDLKFTTETSEDANNVEQMIKGLIAFANLQLKEEKDILELLKRLHISIDGTKVQIGFSYPVEKLLNILLGRTKIHSFFLLGEF